MIFGCSATTNESISEWVNANQEWYQSKLLTILLQKLNVPASWDCEQKKQYPPGCSNLSIKKFMTRTGDSNSQEWCTCSNFQRSWHDFPGHTTSLPETSCMSWFHDNKSYGSELVEDCGPRVPEWSKPSGEMPLLKLSRQPTWKWQHKEVQLPNLSFSWFPVSYMFGYCIDIVGRSNILWGLLLEFGEVS